MEESIQLSDDEIRLVYMFRALPSCGERNEVLERLGGKLLQHYFPEASIFDFMPQACGIEPSGSIYDQSSVAHVIYSGIEETGDPSLVLLGSSEWDQDKAIPRFAYGASDAALEQGSFFNYNEAFAKQYLKAWRWELVWAFLLESRDAGMDAAPKKDQP